MNMSKGYIYNTQASLFGHTDIIGYGKQDFYVKEILRNKAVEIIKKNHYSKKVYNGTYINLGVFYKNELKGVLQYGYAMNPASCSSVVKGTLKNEYLELNRMWIDFIDKREKKNCLLKEQPYPKHYEENKIN